MFALLYLLLVGLLALFVQTRVALLDSFRGLPKYLCALGLTFFLVTWANFLLYVVCGWGQAYVWLSWAAVLAPLVVFSKFWKLQSGDVPDWRAWREIQELKSFREVDAWFLFLAAFVVIRFYVGLDLDPHGNVWTTFNFVDTAFHLSVVNAFLSSPGFPPMDLDMPPYPLKYHFIADFNVAHLARLGSPALTVVWGMNLISATIMVGAIWAAFQRWLRLPPRWVMLAGLIFLFLNTSLINLIHYATLHPQFLHPDDPYYGLLRFPYFNFESSQKNLLEPQRALLFSFPVILLVLHAAFGDTEDEKLSRVRVLQAFILVCLLPLAHIVAFAVLAPSLVPQLWRHRAWFFARWWIWLPVFLVGVLQLLYLAVYGPPTNADFSGWSFTEILPLHDFAVFPVYLRRLAFWFFTNGDFFFWGAVFGALAYFSRHRRTVSASSAPGVGQFLFRWRWYFAVCGGFFVLINVFRYSFDWGDSNKFVLFLNLGLTLVIALGAAQWIQRRGRAVSRILWAFFFVLCVGPSTYAFYDNVLAEGHGRYTVLLFESNDERTAMWARSALPPREIILTSAYPQFHFVTPLAGRPTLAGIYGDSNPYRQNGRKEAIRRVYEDADFEELRQLHVRYVCVSRRERFKYKLNPKWTEMIQNRQALAFSSGGGPGDLHAVYIFDSFQFNPP